MIRIPRRENIRQVADSDPVRYYYLPLVRRLYLGRLTTALAALPPHSDRLLEVGYGCGILLPELSAHCRELTAVDIHPESAKVREMMEKEGLPPARLLTMDILSLDLPDRAFDGLICISVLEHIRDLHRAVGEIHRVLDDKGTAVVGFPRSGRMMKILFTSIGFSHIDEHHVSGEKQIVSALESRFPSVEVNSFPPFLPASLALYYVCRCRKG